MKAVTAVSVVVALLALLTGVPLLLVHCPLLIAKASPVHNCCPSRRPEPAKCPAAPTLDLCPYILSDAKLGAPEFAKSAPILPAVLANLILTPSPVSSPAAVVWRPPDSGLYLRIHVLRI